MPMTAYESCVLKVKAKLPKKCFRGKTRSGKPKFRALSGCYNPWAVCRKSVKNPNRKSRSNKSGKKASRKVIRKSIRKSKRKSIRKSRKVKSKVKSDSKRSGKVKKSSRPPRAKKAISLALRDGSWRMPNSKISMLEKKYKKNFRSVILPKLRAKVRSWYGRKPSDRNYVVKLQDKYYNLKTFRFQSKKS